MGTGITTELTLLGGFAMRVDARPLEGLPRKARALLAYLTSEQIASREAIADLLWTDRGADQARHSLRQVLLVLRQALGTAICTDEGSVSLHPSVASDLAALVPLCRSEQTGELETVVDLYRGPLLAGFPPVATGFDAWLDAKRDAVATAALAAMQRLVDLLLAIGESDRAVRVAERMVVLDPLREDLHRCLMTTYVAAGRRSDALRQYETCVQTLRRELDISPASETRALIGGIRREEGAPSHDDGARLAAATVAPGPPWLAVLPFRTLTPDTVQAYFAEGLTEDIIAALATQREPIVISHGSTLAYCGKAVDPREVGRTLGVRYVVSGSLRRVGSCLRVGSELAECDNGTVLWAGTRDLTDNTELFDTQDELTARIVNTVMPVVHDAELRRARVKPPQDMSAYELVLQARELMYRLKRTEFERAGALLRQAVMRDPGYANAWALAAEWHSLRVGQGWSDNPAADAAAVDRCAHTAIEQEATNARGLAFHGHNYAFLRRDYDTALSLFDRALVASPNNAAAWVWSAPTLAYIGDAKTAIKHAARGLRLSPRDPFIFQIYSTLCLAYYTDGNYAEAVHWGRLSMQENPAYTSNLRFTAASLVAAGGTIEARAVARQIMELQPDFRVRALINRHPYRDADRRNRLGQQLVAAGLPA